MDKLAQLDGLLSKMRSLSETKPEVLFPVSFGVDHQPVDPMHFEVGKWTETPWPGVTCFGVSLSEKEVVIICQVENAIRLNKQEHGPWVETLVMVEGTLHEHTTGETFSVGKGVYLQPAGVIHEPEFKTPSRCVITWSR